MNHKIVVWCLLTAGIGLPTAQAQDAPDRTPHCTCADIHEPIGIMGGHLHPGNEVMMSYRFMSMKMEGLRSGTDSLSNHEALARGFDRVPSEMTMDMHMLGFMFASEEGLTLMAMVNYVSKDMTMTSGGSGMSHGMSGQHGSGSHNHETSGIGDVVLSALFPLFNSDAVSAHAGIGFGLPTAEVEEKQNGMFQPYGMQLGNGVWDIRPSVTILSNHGASSCGAQLSARMNMEDRNDAGFTFGNQTQATAWYTANVNDSLSLSGRILYDYQADINEHYNGPHGHGSPPDLQENYGGDIAQAGVGLTYIGSKGVLSGHHLAVEALFPIHEDLNGIQMERDYSIIVGWRKDW